MAKARYLHEVTTEKTTAKLNPYTVALLQKSRVPIGAYIAIEVPKRRAIKDSSGKFRTEYGTTGIMVMNLEDQPDQRNHLRQLISSEGRNLKVICYGNFPTVDDSQVWRRKKYLSFSNLQTTKTHGI